MSRLHTVSRVVAGTLGAYGVTALAIMACSRLLIALGADPVEASLGASIGSFALFAGICIAVFHTPKPQRAWLWLGLAAMGLAGIVWISG